MVEMTISIRSGEFVQEVYHGPTAHVPRVGDRVTHSKGGGETVIRVEWLADFSRPRVFVTLGNP